MTEKSDKAAYGEPPDWTAMVLLSAHRRVRHIAVWGRDTSTWPGTLCRNRGQFPHYGRMDEFPGVPVCTRCRAEVDLIVASIRNADGDHA